MAKTKAENWAGRPPDERVKLYLGMRKHLRAVAAEVGDTVPGEAMALELAARSFGAVAAKINHAKALAKAGCCFGSRVLGVCSC